MNDAERRQLDAEFAKTMAETMKLGAETMKLGAETTKIQAEQRYYPLVALGAIVVSAIASATALVAALIKFVF